MYNRVLGENIVIIVSVKHGSANKIRRFFIPTLDIKVTKKVEGYNLKMTAC